MDKKELYDGFVALEQEMQAMQTKLAALKESMAEVVGKNAELAIENQHLLAHLKALEAHPEHSSTGAEELSKSKLNLENLYEEGFHVCTDMYGQRRIDNEPCMFCMDIIYGKR